MSHNKALRNLFCKVVLSLTFGDFLFHLLVDSLLYFRLETNIFMEALEIEVATSPVPTQL